MKIIKFLLGMVCLTLFMTVVVVGAIVYQENQWHAASFVPSSTARQTSSSSAQASSSSSLPEKKAATPTPKPKPAPKKPKEKSAADKKAVMEADLVRMDSLGLYYQYDKLTLVETVKAYLDEFGIVHNQVAFSYKDITTGKTEAFNETQPMTAGSTYKLPLNMLVVDEVEKGDLSMEESYDITHLDYENLNEYRAYLGQFNGAMTIDDMQKYSLVYSENTPAYALANILGGFDTFHSRLTRYGQSKSAEVPTISATGNQTTSDYYIQVLDYLYKHHEKYKDICYYIGISFENQYYKQLNPGIKIEQKPGYVREALNVDAIVYEEKPYLIALYTAGLGGSNEQTEEINMAGYTQLIQLCYVINEWHRVNMN